MGESMDFMTVFAPLFVIFGIAVFCVVVLPVILPVETVITGEVTSVEVLEGVGRITPTTNIHFKDGTTIYVWGAHHEIPIGTHTFHVVSSWFGVNELKEWS